MLFKKKAKPETGTEVATTDGAPEGEAAAPAKKGLPLKMLVIAGAGAVVVLGGGGAGAFFLLQPKAEAHGADAGHEKPKKAKKADKGGHGKGGKEDKEAGQVREGPDGVVFYTLPDMVVNIQSPDGRPTFLKLKLTFELPDHEAAEHMQADAPRIKDMFQTFLRELRPEDLSGSQGSYQLRMEILRRVNLILGPDQVKAVLIEEMLIQ
ncbi:MAG TPA: flagellar basal body-associated FliL family protein [Caulobacteraceae bacterium]|nr:flagellar basal body-associated FliL family protein [Caulobacteraceae bacterium]